LPAKAVPEMTYTVSGGTLNPTHSLSGLWSSKPSHHDMRLSLVCVRWLFAIDVLLWLCW